MHRGAAQDLLPGGAPRWSPAPSETRMPEEYHGRTERTARGVSEACVDGQEGRPADDAAQGRPAMSPVAEGHRGGIELIERFASEWRQLCDEGPTDQPFYRPEWIRAHLRAFAPQARLLLVTSCIAGRLRAILPLIEERRSLAGVPTRVLRSPANVHSGRFDLVRGPGSEGEAATAALWRFLETDSQWDALELDYVPCDAALELLLAAAARDGYSTEREEGWRTPYIPLGGHAGSEGRGLEGTDAKFRANLRRRLRKLSSRGSVTLRRIDRADPVVLQRIYDVEASGWKGREGSAITSNGDTRQFYDEIAREAERYGYLSLYLLELDGRPVAGHFGLAHRGRYFLPKPTYDESYREYSPGQLLIQGILADCVERGHHEFDFLGHLADWKADWTSSVRIHNSWHVFRHRRVRTLHWLTQKMSRARAVLGRPGNMSWRSRLLASRVRRSDAVLAGGAAE